MLSLNKPYNSCHHFFWVAFIFTNKTNMKQIEKPMNMNHRESYAWQLGWGKGADAEREDIIEKIDAWAEKYAIGNSEMVKHLKEMIKK